MPGDETSQRAAMFRAVIAGFQVMRQVVEMAASAQAKPDQLARQLEALCGLLSIGTSIRHATG
jgi:hypothetical protein